MVSTAAVRSGGSVALGEIKDSVAQLQPALQHLLQQDQELWTTVEQLKERLQLLEAQVLEDQQNHEHILLGHVARTFDKAACQFVYQDNNNPHHVPIGELQMFYKNQLLDELQAGRWLVFSAFLAAHGWTTKRLIAAMAPLRRLRQSVAHGTAEQQAAVTPGQLRAWVNLHTPLTAAVIDELLQLLSLLTETDQPLMLRPNVSEVIAARGTPRDG